MNTMFSQHSNNARSQLETMTVLDMTVRLRISSDTTSGASSLSEWTLPPYSAGLPTHWHARTQKLCYVLQGVVAWTLDQQTFTATANDCVVIPQGAHHCFFNPAAEPVKLLMWSLPGGIEQHIADAIEVTSPSLALMEEHDYFIELCE